MAQIRFFHLLLLMLIPGELYAQYLIVDLEKIAIEAESGWDKIDAHLGLSRFYMLESEPEKAKESIQKIREFGEVYRIPEAEAYALILENMIAYLFDSEVDKAIDLCKLAMEIAKDTGDQNAYVYAKFMLAENYIWEKGNPELGKALLTELTIDLDETVALKNHGNVYKALGVANAELGYLIESLSSYRKAHDIFKQITNNPPIDPRINRVSTQNMDGEFHLGSTMDSMADLYLKLGNADSALSLKYEALEIFEHRGVPMDIAWVHGNLGEVYFELGYYQQALEHLQKGRIIFDELNLPIDIARLNTQMVDLFIELGDYIEAEKYVDENLAFYKDVNNMFLYAPTLIQAITISIEKNEMDIAEQRITEAEPIINNLNNITRKASFSKLRGDFELEINNYDNALAYYQKCVEEFHQINHSLGIINCELALGNTHFLNKELDKAIDYISMALEGGKSIGELDLITEAYLLRSVVFAEQKDFESAYKNNLMYNAYKDSIFTVDAQAKLKEEQVRQNVVAFQNEKELAEENASLLSQRNRLYLGLGIVLFAFLLMMGYLYINLRKVQSKLKEQNLQLLQLNSTKDKFFGIIAHDLRSPLMGLQSVGNQISYFLEKNQKKNLETLADRIDTSTKKLTDLLDNLLNWALLQNGMIPYHPEKIDLNTSVDSCLELLRPLAEIKEVSLLNSVSKPLFVYADSKALQTILRNIISNAIKYTNQGDKIEVTVEKRSDTIIIAINDTGLGIAAELIPKIFEINNRSMEGTKGEKGTGLGLVLCKELVELNQGRIRVQSELGKGTSFIFDLPKFSEVA